MYVEVSIKDKKLFLNEVETTVIEKDSNGKNHFVTKSIKKDIFPKKKEVIANWYSGILIIPRGKQQAYIHMGYASLYNNYLLIEVKDGKTLNQIDIKSLDYLEHKFKWEDFLSFQKTKSYKAIIEKLKSPKVTKKAMDHFLQNLLSSLIYYEGETP